MDIEQQQEYIEMWEKTIRPQMEQLSIEIKADDILTDTLTRAVIDVDVDMVHNRNFVSRIEPIFNMLKNSNYIDFLKKQCTDKQIEKIIQFESDLTEFITLVQYFFSHYEIVDKEINTDSKDRLPNITELEAEKLYDSSDEVRKRIF